MPYSTTREAGKCSTPSLWETGRMDIGGMNMDKPHWSFSFRNTSSSFHTQGQHILCPDWNVLSPYLSFLQLECRLLREICPDHPRKNGSLITLFPAFICVPPGPFLSQVLVIFFFFGVCFFLLVKYRLHEDKDSPCLVLSSVFTAQPSAWHWGTK